MAESASNIQNLCASMQGLDLLFQDHQDQLEQKLFQDQDHMELVPLVEAAKRLGVTRRYAHKLASSGRLQAIQDAKGHWLVKMEQGQIQIQIQDQVEQKVFQDQDHMEHTQFQAQVISGYQQQIKELQGKFDAAQEQLQGASFRNGYLESQVNSLQNELQNQTETIKLLTDSKPKSGWWQKFKENFSK
ncbi:MAG: hypothetical protein ACRDHZ_02745 [Ktedonobacteraceae bacterium]